MKQYTRRYVGKNFCSISAGYVNCTLVFCELEANKYNFF